MPWQRSRDSHETKHRASTGLDVCKQSDLYQKGYDKPAIRAHSNTGFKEPSPGRGMPSVPSESQHKVMKGTLAPRQ